MGGDLHEPAVHNQKKVKAKHTILVVDDEIAIRDMVAMLLSRHGYDVECAENAAEAVMRLKKGPVDLVVLGVVLADVDAVHLATLTKNMDPPVPILLFSAIGFDDELEAQAKKVGALAYVSKTAPFSKLVSAVQRVLRDPRHSSEGFTQIFRKAKKDPNA